MQQNRTFPGNEKFEGSQRSNPYMQGMSASFVNNSKQGKTGTEHIKNKQYDT